jgi:hypothetical protein
MPFVKKQVILQPNEEGFAHISIPVAVDDNPIYWKWHQHHSLCAFRYSRGSDCHWK